MPSPASSLLGVCAASLVFLVYFASSELWQTLSPQGCRMSWMSPSYVLQTDFNATWSPLTRRYSLWLYREVGWDPVLDKYHQRNSVPVLFIPGNAGSSRQVRSIASSATRQFYASPNFVSPDANNQRWKALDFFAVEFNEDLSAFHGSTLDAEVEYTSKAISYILSFYPPGTQVIVIGHSMGGIVATSLLPSVDISAIITLSTPHTLPPARFDSRIDTRYSHLQQILREDTTPIVSLCGGATDLMIPAESCILPIPVQVENSAGVFRRTVFSSALEGAWTGVGHREMVWCHQVRWRVARAALEMTSAPTLVRREFMLDRWLRDGHSLPSDLDGENLEAVLILSGTERIEMLKSGEPLVLNSPKEAGVYLIPLGGMEEPTRKVDVLVSQGSIRSVAPQNPLPLRVSVYGCAAQTIRGRICQPLDPRILKLIPHPIPGKLFPVPHEGSDESEGVVFYEAVVDDGDDFAHIAIKVDNPNGQGWVAASVTTDKLGENQATSWDLLLGNVDIDPSIYKGLSQKIDFPRLLPSSLLVYKLRTPENLWNSCSASLFPPLIMHTSHPSETHYFPLLHSPDRHILLHSHLYAPFVDRSTLLTPFFHLTIISSPEEACREAMSGLSLTIDWRASIGRAGLRYMNTLVSWSIGIVSVLLFIAWTEDDRTSHVPSISHTFTTYIHIMLRYLLPASFFASFLPLPASLYLGTQGDTIFAFLGPIILLIASGLVVVVWWILCILLWSIARLHRLVTRSRVTKQGAPTTTLVSLCFICAVIFLFIPWQVAYLGCWILMLHTCASMPQRPGPSKEEEPDGVPLMDVSPQPNSPTLDTSKRQQDVRVANYHHCQLLLLLMTWLLPIVAPVLAVWVRTLYTAGFTTPFDGDHNFLSVLPFLILTDYASWMPGPLFQPAKFESRISLRWLFAIIAATAFMIGSRKPYLVFDGARATILIIVVTRIGRRYIVSDSVSAS